MWIEKKYYIDQNWWEKIKNISINERKKWVKNFSKKISPILLWVMISSADAYCNEINLNNLPKYAWLGKWLKRHISVSYNKWTTTDWNNKYNIDYYEKYNNSVKNIENTNLSWIEKLNVIWWILFFEWQKMELTSANSVIEDSNFLKNNDLNKVIIKINNVPFKVKPKFLKLSFQARCRKWIVGYEVWKTITLVYISYLNKIKVLWTIEKYAWYIEENNPKEYEVILNRKNILYTKCEKLLWYKNYKYKKDRSWNVYFYSNWVYVGTLNNMWNEKILTKWNKVIAKIIEHWDNIIMMDEFGNILYKTNWQKKVSIKLPTAGEKIILLIDN